MFIPQSTICRTGETTACGCGKGLGGSRLQSLKADLLPRVDQVDPAMLQLSQQQMGNL